MNRPDTVSYTGIPYAIATCDDCGWTTQCHKNALANAKRHHNATGHTVQVEQMLIVAYTRRGSPFNLERTKNSHVGNQARK
jgi:hypothetical protein